MFRKQRPAEELSDEQLDDFLNENFSDSDSVKSVEDVYSSGDEINDDYTPDPTEQEVNSCIENALNDMAAGESSTAFICNATNLTFDMSAIEAVASSTLREFAELQNVNAGATINIARDVPAYEIVDNVDLLSSPEYEEIFEEVVVPVDDEEATTTARSRPFRKAKRRRSPLPSLESSGPSFTPNAGGFTGAGKRIHHISIYYNK